jgi:two-component system cell cycle sensor histidine kinase/response regulator CckA
VLGIVRGHHGALRIESTPGGGTTVTVLLPPFSLPAPGGVARVSMSAPSQDTSSDRRASTVLVVDDEPDVRAVTSRLLARLGYRVLTAAGGPVALDMYRAHASEIAVVLLDLTMPQMSGKEVFGALRQIDAGVRVVMMSGYTPEEMRAHFTEASPAGFLQKPFTPALLHELVRKAELAK